MFNIKNSISLLVINLVIVLSTGYQQPQQQPHSQYGPAPVRSNSYRQTIQSYSHPSAAVPVPSNGHPLIQHPPPQYSQYPPVASRSPTYEVVNGHPQLGQQNSPQYSFAASRSQPLVHGQPRYIHVPPTQPGQVTRSHQIIDARTGEVILKKHYGTDGKYVVEETRYHSNPNEQFKPLIDLALRSSPYQQPLPMHHETRENNVFHSTGSLHSMNGHPAGNQYQGRSVVDPKQDFYSRNDFNKEEVSSPIVRNLPHQPAGSSKPRDLETLVSYIQSSDFMETIKSMGKSNDFKSTVIRAVPEGSIEKDDKLIKLTIENSGLNFTRGDEDCVPRKTIVKFGDQNKPEIMYNPPTVEVLRCPHACFSWQFDCVPVTPSIKQIEVAVYTIGNDHQVNRTTEVYSIPIHTKCACKCQTFSSCFGNVTFGFSKFSNQPNL